MQEVWHHVVGDDVLTPEVGALGQHRHGHVLSGRCHEGHGQVSAAVVGTGGGGVAGGLAKFGYQDRH